MSRFLTALAVSTAFLVAWSPGVAVAQSTGQGEGNHRTPPSQDIAFALGDWVVEGEHPVLGNVKRWTITLSDTGAYLAEIQKDADGEPLVERGVWISIDGDVMSFMRTSVNLRRGAPNADDIDLYTIQAIYPAAIDLQRTKDGKPIRLTRATI